MEFWASEVQPGKPSQVELGDSTYLHISQVALGESKDGKESTDSVVLKASVDDQEIVIGTLVRGKCDHIGLDLIFNKRFKLSHNSTAYNVYFCGYTSEPPGDELFSSDEEDEEEDVQELTEGRALTKANGGKPAGGGKSIKSDVPVPATKSETPSSKSNNKVLAAAGKPGKVGKDNATPSTGAVAGHDSKKASKQTLTGSSLKAGKKASNVEEDSDDQDDEEDDEDEDEFGEEDDEDEDEDEEDSGEEDDEDESDEDMEDIDDAFDSEAEEEDEDEEEEEQTPKSKKRDKPSSDAAKTLSSGKKQKLSKPGENVKPGIISTPGKKSADKTASTPAIKEQKVAAQSAKKTPGKPTSNSKDSTTPKKQNTPGTKDSPYKCTPCSRSFTTESGLSQHNTAKHKNA